MDIYNKFTTHYKKSILNAYSLSLSSKKKEIGIEELFWSLSDEKGSLGQESLAKAGIKSKAKKNVKRTKASINLENLIESKETIPLSEELKNIIVDSTRVSAEFDHSYIGTEHLLYSLIRSNNEKINLILNKNNIKTDELTKNLEMLLDSTSKFSEMTDAVGSIKGKLKNGKPLRAKRDSMLEFFGTDLTNTNAQKNINPVIGREDEINRVIQILSRRDKNNPILLGEPGVGKTAIVEGLAKKILERDVAEVLHNKKIYSLDLALIVAGTNFRGEFEARIKQIVDEVREDKNIILFIDEIHNIAGAGSTSGTMDAANILKPALARGEIRCIGATTYDDYKKHIEPDTALSRRMQKVSVREPSEDESVKILKGIKSSYEKHHLITITDEAIEAAVNLSGRYITDQFLPDKAIDLIDEAASKKRINRPKNKNVIKLNELKLELENISKKKNQLVTNGKYNEALRLKSEEVEIVNKIYKVEEEEIKAKMTVDPEQSREDKILAEDISEIVSEATKINIPDNKKSGSIIKEIDLGLKKHIIGQDKVIGELANTLKRTVAGLTGELRPLGSFIFTGPSGVGKTYSAKILASLMSPGREGLIKLDMSEYGEKFNASKLIGAPAGYIGYDEGGQLTERVKRNPYSVILLDEIEKAHADIFNLFLQIFEDGYLTDSKGRVVNFRNTIIIMTTNIGLKKSAEGDSIGFGDEVKYGAREKLSEWMRPELLNRIDQIISFDELTSESLARIIELELGKINNNLKKREINIKWNKGVINYLLRECGGSDQGARIIRDVIRERIENKLADRILSNSNSSEVNIKLKNDKIIFE